MTKKSQNYLVNRIKINNFYLANVKFEDGYNKSLGTNYKKRPVLILDKIVFKNKTIKYIVVPIYSNQNKANFYLNYHLKINNWTSIQNDKQLKNVKFKINQIQFLSQKELTYKYSYGNSKYFWLKNNSPFKDIEKLKRKIEYTRNLKFKNPKFKAALLVYLSHQKQKEYQKKYRKDKNKTFEMTFFK